MTKKAYSQEILLKFVGDLNALASGGALDLGTPPDDFVFVDGYVDCAQGTTANEISIGDGTTAALFLDDVSIASGTIDGVDLLVTARGFKFDGSDTITITNSGSAAIPSSATAITVNVRGYMEHEA